MQVTTKELRMQPGKIIDHVALGDEVTVTFRGKILAKIVPVEGSQASSDTPEPIFGMWKSHKNVDSVDRTVRAMRKRRSF